MIFEWNGYQCGEVFKFGLVKKMNGLQGPLFHMRFDFRKTFLYFAYLKKERKGNSFNYLTFFI